MIAVRDQAEFECIVDYIHMSPVRAGLVQRSAGRLKIGRRMKSCPTPQE